MSVCPVSVNSFFPSLTSQSISVLSNEQERIVDSDGEKQQHMTFYTLSIFIQHETQLTASVCPMSVSVEVSCVFHNLTVLSHDAERISVDEDEKQQHLT